MDEHAEQVVRIIRLTGVPDEVEVRLVRGRNDLLSGSASGLPAGSGCS